MSKIYNDITEVVGKTPLVKINKMGHSDVTILVKLESCNPCSSVKDRIAVAMIEAAENSGSLNYESVIIEPTSGNTGIGLAFVCAAKGYSLKLTMPESMSVERRRLLQILGAEIVLTPAELGMVGAIDKAKQLTEEIPNSFMPQQFENPANPEMHRKTTAQEIWEDTDGNIDIFVAGVGTGGTITGCGEALKAKKPNLQIVAVEPADSPVLSGGKPGPHKIQGIGAGFIPEILNTKIIDEVVKVSNDQAIETARLLANKEGILCGISSGANVFAALEASKDPKNKGKTIVAIICDTGERYISTELFA
ncbi:MAG: cysteine synthase A [Sedimentisphaerales bacterium]|nr:cysteine synthase A [Sedimentisphaerales bacterium]